MRDGDFGRHSMTSCPSELELVEFVDGALGAAAAERVEEHLVACGSCRELLARSEAALRLALGGIADSAARPPRAVRVLTRGRLAAAASFLAAAAAGGAWIAGGLRRDEPAAPPSPLIARLTSLRDT